MVSPDFVAMSEDQLRICRLLRSKLIISVRSQAPPPFWMPQIVECVPNFSEARRPEVVDQIAAAVASVSSVRLLDRSSDLDHNRTVLTFAGSPSDVEEAAFRGIRTAATLIDLNQHEGQHPRIGATDVVPFVPLSDVSMDDCVAISKRLGERVGRELQIPVYLYEASAQRPERANLENIRRGEYESLRREITKNPDRAPDYGPAQLGPAGATVIGARSPLIAFNVYLDTSDLEIAKQVAKKVRQSSGGLPYVKALGLMVGGYAQVSMNLTNFRETSVARAVEAVRTEARERGVEIHHTELIGLIPLDAILDAAVEYTKLVQFDRRQVLETRLFESASSPASGAAPGFLDELASPTPAPGGGSAAAYAAAMGAALISMVAGVTIGKRKYAAVEAEMNAVRVHAEKLRQDLTQAVEDDAAAFEAVMGALRLPKTSEAEDQARTAAVHAATLNAAHVPFHVSERAVKIMDLALRCARDGNQNAVSDAMSAFAMARAALTAASYNVRINLNSIDADRAERKMLRELTALERQANVLERQIKKVLDEHPALTRSSSRRR